MDPKKAYSRLISEAAKLARREHSQIDEHAIDVQRRSSQLLKLSADCLMDEVVRLEGRLESACADADLLRRAAGLTLNVATRPDGLRMLKDALGRYDESDEG